MIKKGHVCKIYQDGKETWLGMATENQNGKHDKIQFLNLENAIEEAIEDLYEVVDVLNEAEFVVNVELALSELGE